MDVMEKLIKICFREFCDIAGDSPCGCDGCPYGEYDPDNGGCFDEYKKDKIEKLENDMDKYQKEDNGVTVQECGNWKYYHKQNKAVCIRCGFERDLDANFGKAIACPNCGVYMPQQPKGE